MRSGLLYFKNLCHSGVWFAAVGLLAAAVHLAVFHRLHQSFRPEWANLMGFLVAFGVSFTGHRCLSFKGSTTPVHQSLWRFFLIALAGLATNELSFMFLLYTLGWAVWPALLLAIALAAAQTFILSRCWAFRR